MGTLKNLPQNIHNNIFLDLIRSRLASSREYVGNVGELAVHFSKILSILGVFQAP